MKKIFLLLFCLFLSGSLYSQNENEVRLSMGIDFVSIPSLNDYIGSISRETQNDFNSAIDFSGSYGRMMSESYQLQLEVGYLLYSFTSSDVYGQYNLEYSIIMPSIINYYVLQGNGYNFKFGGGVGVRFLTVNESLPATGVTDEYSSVGYGFILRAEGNTAIAENVYAHIAADTRYDIIGEPAPTSGGNTVGDVDFSSFSVGIRLGLSYQF